MSRLAGRVTFPGKEPEDQENPNYRNPESRGDQNYRNPGGNQNYRNPRPYRSNEDQEEQKPRPRGKGNVRYQGNYGDRFEGPPRNSGPSGRFQEGPDGSQRSERGYGSSGRYQETSERFEGSQRSYGASGRYQEGSEGSQRSYNQTGNPRGSGRGRGRSGRFQNDRNQRFEGPRRANNEPEPKEQENEDQKTQRDQNRKPTQKIEDVMPSEELLELEDIIAQISDLNVRNDRSAAQIKRNILASNDLIDTMDESDWEQVCQSMISTALEQGEPEFIADLMVALLKNQLFSAVMSDELMSASSKHIMEDDDKPIPALLSAVLCAHWPRQYAKAFDNVNPILYTVVCIVKGWIEVVGEDTERYHKEEPKPKYQTRDDQSEDVAPEPQEEEEKIIEEPEMVNLCALALSDLCDTAQRQLWVNWMSLTDEIYQCLKPSITHNPNLTGDVKARLLDTFIQMNQWTKNRQAGVKHAGVQTVVEET